MSDNHFLEQLRWVALDLETTGLNPWDNEILEIGAVQFNLSEIQKKFQVLVKVHKPIDIRSRNIHQISDQEIKQHGINIRDALEKCLDFIQDAPLIFHNASFDLSFLSISLKEHSMKIPSNYYYDNLYLSRKYFPERESHSLANIRKALNINTGQAHRALADAEATAKIFTYGLNKYKTQILSKGKYNKFMRYHRTFNEFKVTLPKNLKYITHYFNKYIQTGIMLKTQYKQDSKQTNMIHDLIQIQEVMIFNQRIILKAFSLTHNKQKLIPLEHMQIHDPIQGTINYTNIIKSD